MNRLRKRKRGKCPEYLEHVRQLGCTVCGVRPNRPHHLVSVGSGGDDLTALPLCDDHHNFGGDSIHNLGDRLFNERHNVDVWKDAHRNLVRWLRDNDILTDE